MGKYTVQVGQNLFDIALNLYGSIEGIVDLMMNNVNLSLADTLKTGDTLEFTDDFVINPDVAAWYRMNNIVPSNGERNVYYKSSAFPPVFKIRLSSKLTSAGFGISGAGNMEIDWGDNSRVEALALCGNMKKLFHTFDNTVVDRRHILMYGDFTIKQADFTDLVADSILLFRPVPTEKFILKDSKIRLDFMTLLKDVYEVNLTGAKPVSLLPLTTNKNLMKLDLSGVHIGQEIVDEYLTQLVKKHNGRRSCTVTLTGNPSGQYREPDRDTNGNYHLTGGMEAVWLLCNEPSWNEAGFWKFIINGQTYTSVNNS